VQRVTIFQPGDYREVPNQLGSASVASARRQLEAALAKMGREVRVIEGFLTRPHEAIERLGSVDDPVIGIYAHWVYAPHTTEGVAGKDNPVLLASNFSGQWPGLVGLLNTGASLTSLGRQHSRIWTDAEDWTADDEFMERLDQWCTTGRIEYPDDVIAEPPAVSDRARTLAAGVLERLRARRPLALMLGDTSMGMINGYFGPQRLGRHGFSEHKVDQAWLIERTKGIGDDRVDDALRFVREAGLAFHHGGVGAEDFDERASREQLRSYCAVLDLVDEFGADCLGWQYQLGLLYSLPPSDLAEGLLNSTCRPESNGDTVATATEADQGNLVPMELMKRLLVAKGLHQSVAFHDVRWGAEHEGRFLWVLLNSGSTGAYPFTHDPETLEGVHSYRQPAAYFPIPGGTFAGESLPGEITWARAWMRGEELVMDVGRGEVVQLPPDVRDRWWEGTTRQWPFMAADLGLTRDDLMAHYQSNHIAVAYGDIFEEMVWLSGQLGFTVRVLGR